MYIGPYSTIEQQIRADAILSRQIYEEGWKQFEKKIKQIPNEYLLDSIRRQSIPNQNKVVSKDREDLLEYLEVPYRNEMQTSRSERSTSERQTTKIRGQNRETNSLDSKHTIRQTIIEPTQDRYDDPRPARCNYNEMPKDLKLSGASQPRYR